MKIYTKKGDSGKTTLVGGESVRKDDPCVEAYGTVDELSAFVALLRDLLPMDQRELRAELLHILNTLMGAEASLAGGAHLSDAAVAWLEQCIDAFDVPPVGRFTLPGGHPLVSQAHVCRTVCRRAERCAVRMPQADPAVLAYLNRLSDYFYVLSRVLANRLGMEELYWNKS